MKNSRSLRKNYAKSPIYQLLKINFEDFISTIHSQIFHQILYFQSQKKSDFFFKVSNISENNIISFEQAQVLSELHNDI